MNLADILLDKERERKDRVKTLLVKAFKTAKLDYNECTVWKIDTHRYLMINGKVIDKEWWNRVVIHYLTKFVQKLIEKGDIGI